MLKEKITRKIIYIKDRATELEGLIFILNEKIINNNNDQQQECTSIITPS